MKPKPFIEKIQFPIKIENSQKKYLKITNGISVLGFLLALTPYLFDISVFDGGGAMIFGGIFIGISAFFVRFIFMKNAQMLDEMIQGKDLWVCWEIDSKVWNEYLSDFEENLTADYKITFRIIFIFTVVICSLLLLLSGFEEAMLQTCFFMMLFMGILKLISVFSPKFQKKSFKNHQHLVLISSKGLWISGTLHTWANWRTSFQSISIDESKKYLTIEYLAPLNHISERVVKVLVPIPPDKSNEADWLIEKFREINS